MNPNKLNHRQREQSASDTHQHTQGEAAREFNTPEELLRHDAATVQPPTEIAARLGEEAPERLGEADRAYIRTQVEAVD